VYKSVTLIYLIVFSTYIFFTRQPDYLDGEITKASIHWVKDSMLSKKIPKAIFDVGKENYQVNAGYLLRDLNEGKQVEVIYENAQPQKAVIYSWWGYWMTAGELIASVILYIALFQVAVAVTKNPSATEFIDELENAKPERKRKYD
jgi:hypothetical protein